MRKCGVVLLAGAILASAGCFGPMVVTRQFDDWMNQLYADGPWLCQILWLTGIVSACCAVAQVTDEFVANPYYFWGQDAFRGRGTPFIHRNPGPPEPR